MAPIVRPMFCEGCRGVKPHVAEGRKRWRCSECGRRNVAVRLIAPPAEDA